MPITGKGLKDKIREILCRVAYEDMSIDEATLEIFTLVRQWDKKESLIIGGSIAEME